MTLEYHTSENDETIISAVAAVQVAIGALKKTKENPFFKSSYADLSDINSALKPIMEKEGLVIQYHCRVVEGKNVFRCFIIHPTTGEYLMSEYAPPEGDDIQKEMAMTTYLRRYIVVCMLNLDTEEDDDGNKASRKSKGTTTKKKRGRRGTQHTEDESSEEEQEETNEDESNEENDESFKKKRRGKGKSTSTKRKSKYEEEPDEESTSTKRKGKGKKTGKKTRGRRSGLSNK